MEKLSQEEANELKKLQHLQQKIHKKVKDAKISKGSQMLPGTSVKVISSTAKKTAPLKKKKNRLTKVSEQIRAAVSSTSTSGARTAALSRNVAKEIINADEEEITECTSTAEGRANMLAEAEELEIKLNEAQQRRSPSNAESEADQNNAPSADFQHRFQSYLEACVFIGDIDRAHRFLLTQHRVRRRRIHLNTDTYNIVMKVWAKKGDLNHIGRIFILLEEAGLKPNLGSYCAALECMGRSPGSSARVITRCLNHMEEDGLSVDDLFSQCVFRQDERDMVLNAIHVVQPKYQPALTTHGDQSLSSLVEDFYRQRTEHYPKLHFTKQELLERFKQQLSMEEECTVTIDSVEASKPITENMDKMRTLLSQLRKQWHKTLLQTFKENKKILSNIKFKDYKVNLYPFLCVLKDHEYVDIMVQSLTSLPPSGESLKIFARDLGSRVYTKYSVRQKEQNQMVQKICNIYTSYTDILAKDTEAASVLPREHWCDLEAKHTAGPTLIGTESYLPYTVTLELGIFMVDLMVKNLKINSDVLNSAHDRKVIPVLYHMYTFRSTRQIGFIKPHPIFSQILLDAMETKLTFDSYVIPTLCPPVPWTSVKFGAYLLTPTKLMRSVDGATQHESLLEKCQNLQPVMDSLNQLGNCAWKVNKPLLDIIISIFNDKGCDTLGIPPPMSEAPKIPHFSPHESSLTSSEMAQKKREAASARKKCGEMHSLRMDALYKLSIANYMRDEIFWFPHSMDFRGRTYPCPPYFNHLGSDVTRAILLFAEGKPLGPKGLDWLKIHLVNLTGLKKRSSLQERLEFANSIMEDILDSADNPLNGKSWWMNADGPWQALACCMEIANAVRSPDPQQFISHFPVHQDGSCNGLQHYAALGRDVIGATSVNLMPCDLPQDVYSGVAQQVEELRAQDAERNLKIAQVLEGFISRKVVKQTVMTVVYGVTRYGGRLQIEKRLKEIDEFPKDCVFEASSYLVRLVFSSLKEMFTGTREIQDWLTESAKVISKSGHTVEWVTPLGLPIIQPYHRKRNQTLISPLQHISFHISHDTKERPDTVKQKNAFPPNFIHSLDSTHMMLTSLHCYRAGLTFVSVHDCYWTHALTVDTMNKICREQFVALHSQPILQDLSSFLLEKYCSGPMTEAKNKKYQEHRRLMMLLAKVPQTGDFDLQKVKESTYFFS